MVDMGIWVNKDIENQKSFCPFIRMEVDMEMKISPRGSSEVPDRGPEDPAR